MQVFIDPDPHTLERALLDRIAALQSAPGLSRVLLIVPTTRLGEHVQRRLATRFKAVVGVEVVHFRALARRIREASDAPMPRLLSPRLVEALLRQQLEREPANLWTRFSTRRPGTLARLAGVMQDLREAGIDPRHLTQEVLPGVRGRDLARLYALQVQGLDRLAQRGWVDEAGLIAAVLPHAEGFAGTYRGVMVHGMYELVGTHLDLLRALDRGAPVNLFAPVACGSAATAHAESFAREFLIEAGAEPSPLGNDDGASRSAWLAALYDETAAPTPAPEFFAFRHAQGVAAEVRLAVRHVLSAVREGCPPSEIILTARSLAPYAAALEETLEREGLPWTGSITTPLALHPVARTFLLAIDVVRDDFPRRSTVELLRSPLLCWSSLATDGERPRADRADETSLEAGLIGGLVEWCEVLPDWVARDRGASSDAATQRTAQLHTITAALKALAQRLRPEEPRRWKEHAAVLTALLDELLPVPQEPLTTAAAQRIAHDALREVLQELRELDEVLGEHDPVPFAVAVERVDAAVRGVELSAQPEDGAGLRVVDVMQLRGMTCRRLFLLGANSDQLPRAAREDPLLPDAVRRRLRSSTRRPLPLPLAASAEERLLLMLVVGCAAERVTVSWQRADEAGRARMPSLALRELARLARGRPELSAVVAAAEHAPSHPEHSLAALAQSPGLLTRDEETLLALLTTRAPLDAVALEFPALADGLRLLHATESFAPGGGSFDGRVGAAAAQEPVMSITQFEQLGRCPLQYFFRHVLHAREAASEPDSSSLAHHELGLLVHRVLEQVYARLGAMGAMDPDKPAPTAQELTQGLRRAWDAALGEPLRRRADRLPTLWAARRDSWLHELGRFVQEDLARIRAQGWGSPELEVAIESVLDLPSGRRLALRGRLDRRFATPDGPLVSDYKTGAVDELCSPSEMLKGRRLQVPLYALLGGEPRATVEIIALDPYRIDDEEPRKEFAGFEGDGCEAGLIETLDVLAGLREHGLFPLRSGEHCSHCAYALACRRNHPPTEHREKLATDSADFRRLLGKSTRRPLLANLQDAEENGDNDE